MTSPSTEDYLAENVSGNLERVPEAPEETSVTEATPNIQKPRDMKSYTFGLIVIAVLSSIFLFSLDNTVVADVQPAIVGSLGDIEKLPWISVSFALGAVSVNLIWGRLFGEFDSKILFICAVFLFEIGSAICGSAPTMDALIVGRAICGLGGSGIYIGAMNIISVLTTEVERPLYLSFFGLTWGVGTVLGPIIGGAFADSSATWRWSFYINLCVGVVCAPVYFILLPSHNPHPEVSIKERMLEIDVIGGVLVAGAFVSGIMAISFGGAVYDWNSSRIIGLFVCSGVLWALFGIQQGRQIFTTRATQIFPVQFLKNYELIILFAQTAAANTAVYVPIYFIPLYFEFVRDESALAAGVRLLPFICVLVFSVILNGAMMGKLGYYMPWYFLGGALSLIGGSLFYTVDIDSSNSRIYGYSVITAFGAGVFSQASFPVSQAKVKPELTPLAVAFIGCSQIAGITLALSISNAIFINEATDRISAVLQGVSRDTVQQAISGVDSHFFATLGGVEGLEVLEAIVTSIRRVYIMVIAAGALAVILSLFMKREKLFVKPSTPLVLDEIEKS